MKIGISGASAFVNRMYEACGSYQWAREFLKNSLEARATRIEFGLEWQAVERFGVYRRTVMDDGCGMDRNELLTFFSTLGVGAKKIGGVHENFGVGAKIASLPWNPEGVVVISYKDTQASLIWIVLDQESGDYELVEFETEAGTKCVIEPQELDNVEWHAIRPVWIKDHGTIVVLLGSQECPDTMLGNPLAGEKGIKGLSVYLNTRFWDLSNVDLKVVELRSDKKAQWPLGRNDRDDARRPNNRQILGARHWLTDLSAEKGRVRANGILSLAKDRVEAEWYLWEGDRPEISSCAKRTGYLAVRYHGELFQLTSNKVDFRSFGIVEHAVQQNLTIILEPKHYQTSNGRWGVHPDQSRNRLIFTGNGEKGVGIPLSDWGLEFMESMPQAILAAISEARGESGGFLEDESYRKRLQDKFGERWRTKVLVRAHEKDTDQQPATGTDEDVEVFENPGLEGKPAIERKLRRSVTAVRKRAVRAGSHEGAEREVPVDVPSYRLAKKDDFQNPEHLALWAPQDPAGPTVLINRDSSILQEVVEYHQAQYPDIFAEEVADTVRRVFGEVATCKVAHSQKLARTIPTEKLDLEYRSEQALTVALMGLLAEEAVIAQRLGKLGRKKPAA